MKKALIPILLVLLLTLAFTSCDANIRQDIADLMGDFSENVYIANGFVEANTANAAAVTSAVAAIGSQDVTADADDESFGIVVKIPEGVTKVIRPQTEAEQEETKDNLATAFASPTQTKELVESMKAPASIDQKDAASGTVKLFNDTLTALQGQLTDDDLKSTLAELALPEIEDTSALTQGDILVLQMMTNLVSNTISSLKDETDTINNKLDKDKIFKVVDDALFTAKVAEELSGAASIDFSGQLDLAGLLAGMDDDTDQSVSRISRVEDEEDDMGEILVAFNDLIPDLLPVMGITVSGSDYTYTKAKYQSFLMNQKAYRGSIEHALRFVEKSGLELSEVPNANIDTSTLIKYIISIVITEHHAYWVVEEKETNSPRPEKLIETLFDQNHKLGHGEMGEDDDLVPLEPANFSYDGFEAFIADRPYELLIQNLKDLNTINEIKQLNEVLDELQEEIAAWETK